MMSCLMICKDCKGWRWTPGPEWEEAMVEFKLKEIKELKAKLQSEGKTWEQYKKEQGWGKYEFPPLREGECGCGR